MKKIVCAVLLLLLSVTVHAQSFQLSGDWKGYISIKGQHLIIKTHFKEAQDGINGTLDIPQQGVSNMHLQKIAVTPDDSVYFEANAGISGVLKFKGFFKTDSTITGSFHQNGYQFPFKLHRYSLNKAKKKPRPYHHKDVIIQVNDSIQIGGTLTWPKDQKTDQLVIMTTGSGAENRDEEVFGFKIFGQIADYLTRHGIATFRYDDRGVGESSGSLANATLEMLAGDVETIVNYFSATHDSVPAFSEIILLGHSKGGLVAGIAAAERKVADKLILMSSPGIPLSEILIYQFSRKIKKMPFTEEQKQNQIALLKNMIMAVANDDNIEKAKKAYHEQLLSYLQTLPDSVQTKMGSLKSTAKRMTIFPLRLSKLSKRITMLSYNPATDLKTLDIPVLVLLGGNDVQVTVGMNKEPIKEALEKAGVPYEIKVFPNANHLYQEAKNPNSSYATLKDEFVNGFLETIAKWVKQD